MSHKLRVWNHQSKHFFHSLKIMACIDEPYTNTDISIYLCQAWNYSEKYFQIIYCFRLHMDCVSHCMPQYDCLSSPLGPLKKTAAVKWTTKVHKMFIHHVSTVTLRELEWKCWEEEEMAGLHRRHRGWMAFCFGFYVLPGSSLNVKWKILLHWV